MATIIADDTELASTAAPAEPPPPPTFDDLIAAYVNHSENDRLDLTWLEVLGAYIDGRVGGSIKSLAEVKAEAEAAKHPEPLP
jgi:hypothetical protein